MVRIQSATTIPIELLKKYDCQGPRYTSYPTAPTWTDHITVEDYKNALITASNQSQEPLAIYCHIPFCQRRCFYCGCTTYVSRGQTQVSEYIIKMRDEIAATEKLLMNRRNVSQIHFGGGTPTFIGMDGIGNILKMLQREFCFVDNSEMSIEVDPRVTSQELIAFLAEHGFNRISIGVQDFNLEVQQAIGRVQPVEQVVKLLDQCRRHGFKGINFDLIYGLPLQTKAGFGKSIDQVIKMRPDRVALYSFAYLPNLRANQLKIRASDIPSTETRYSLFSLAVEKFTSAGYRQIGMDHFALPEDELAKAQASRQLHRNFMGYTIRTASDMIGFGMSAIGYVNNTFFQNNPKLAEYKGAISTQGLATYRGKRLSFDDRVRQYVISSLMCDFELSFRLLRNKYGIDYREYFGSEHSQLAGFVEDGLLHCPPGGLQITDLGRAFVRNICMIFDAYLPKFSEVTQPMFSRTI